MTIAFDRSFDKQFTKLTKVQKQQVRDAVELFIEHPLHESLRNHTLIKEWSNYHSITAADDLRLHYRIISTEKALFVAVGTHSELYK
jgi:addiction module RelE/StbE family toxin